MAGFKGGATYKGRKGQSGRRGNGREGKRKRLEGEEREQSHPLLFHHLGMSGGMRCGSVLVDIGSSSGCSSSE